MNSTTLLALVVATAATACTDDATPATHEDMAGVYTLSWTCTAAACDDQPAYVSVHVSRPGGGNVAFRYFDADGRAVATDTGAATFMGATPCVRVIGATSGSTYDWCLSAPGQIENSRAFPGGDWLGSGELEDATGTALASR